MNIPGLPNFAQVSPTLYRGAQPLGGLFAPDGLGHLEAMAVRTVVNLEMFSLSERLFAWAYCLQYVGISCKPWHPEMEDVRKFLAVVRDPDSDPVFVHCRQGADRTGIMCAVYRIAIQSWSKMDAIDEMVNGGWGFHGDLYPEIVPFIQALDVKTL